MKRISQPGDTGRERRLAAGREQRNRLSRAKLGQLRPRAQGFDPVKLLSSASSGRIAALLPLKYSRMTASPFAFFRGSVALMAADLAREPHTDLAVQLCGDAHLQNMGSFQGPDGRLVFDINDFDETLPGPWDWDVKRMAASIVLAGLESEHKLPACESAVETFAASYCTLIESLAEQPILVAARYQIHRLQKTEAVSAAFAQAERATPSDLLRKYTETGSGGRVRFKKIDQVIWRVRASRREGVLASLPNYRKSLPIERLHLFDFFQPLDVAFKIVGTGSVGLRDYLILMQGNGESDPLFLQIKQEVASIYAPYLGGPAVGNQGQRVAEGQRKVQPLSDLLLGWTRIGANDYLVRQLSDHKGGVDLAHLKGEGLAGLAAIAGELLARGHARSGDALAIKGYIGAAERLVKAVAHYGLAYAERAQSDFHVFQKAVRAEQVKVAAA